MKRYLQLLEEPSMGQAHAVPSALVAISRRGPSSPRTSQPEPSLSSMPLPLLQRSVGALLPFASWRKTHASERLGSGQRDGSLGCFQQLPPRKPRTTYFWRQGRRNDNPELPGTFSDYTGGVNHPVHAGHFIWFYFTSTNWQVHSYRSYFINEETLAQQG